MTAFYTYLSTLTLDVNGFNSPIKSNRIAGRVRNKFHLFVVYKTSALTTSIAQSLVHPAS